MCMLTYVPEGVEITDADGIYNGALVNNDGHGWAIVAEGRILKGHSMDPDEALDDFLDARWRNPRGPALFHSRWATHGSISPYNCHPFKVAGDSRTVLAHNGILPKLAHPLKGDKRSDTRKFAESLMPKWGDIDNPRNFKALSEWLGGYNKILILTANPKYKQQAYLFNEKAGIWAGDGLWFSNSDYQYSWTAPTKGLTPSDEFNGDTCPWCFGTSRVNWEAGMCEDCLSCLYCIQPIGVCICHNEKELSKPADVNWWNEAAAYDWEGGGYVKRYQENER